MTTNQLIERMRDALIACTEELEAFAPDDRQTLDFGETVLKEYVVWYGERHDA